VSASVGYVYVTGWDKFQHPDATRSGHMPWLKMYTDLLGNDAWLDLSAVDRCLLQTIWMLTASHGNGRLKADQRWLMASAKLPYGPRSRSLERLNQAGFIEVLASKSARHSASKSAGLDKDRDVGSIEPTKTKSVASSARRNGAARKHQKHLATAVATAREWKLDDPDHLERDVRETWPDAADFILSRVAAIPAQNGENGSNHEKPATQEPTSAPRADDRDQPVEDIDDMDIPF
jgi:hypothetical protein